MLKLNFSFITSLL